MAVYWLSLLSHAGTTGVHEGRLQVHQRPVGLGAHISGQRNRNVWHNLGTNFWFSVIRGVVSIPTETTAWTMTLLQSWDVAWLMVFELASINSVHSDRPWATFFLVSDNNSWSVNIKWSGCRLLSGHLQSLHAWESHWEILLNCILVS